MRTEPHVCAGVDMLLVYLCAYMIGPEGFVSCLGNLCRELRDDFNEKNHSKNMRHLCACTVCIVEGLIEKGRKTPCSVIADRPLVTSPNCRWTPVVLSLQMQINHLSEFFF